MPPRPGESRASFAALRCSGAVQSVENAGHASELIVAHVRGERVVLKRPDLPVRLLELDEIAVGVDHVVRGPRGRVRDGGQKTRAVVGEDGRPTDRIDDLRDAVARGVCVGAYSTFV